MNSTFRPARLWRILPILLLCGLLAACQSAEDKHAEHLQKAAAFLAEGRDPDAIIELRAALSAVPESAIAHFELAKAYIRIKNLPAAYWELQESVRLNPENDEARRSLAALALSQGEFEEALEQADKAISRDFSAGDAYLVRAKALEALERMEEAERAYRAAADVRPDDSGYVMILAGFYERAGNKAKAEELMRKVIDMEGTFESHLAYAMYLRREERREEAITSFRKSLELARDVQKHLIYGELARYYKDLGEHEKVVEVLEEGIDKAKKSEPLILQLTRYYRGRGEDAKADELIARVTEERRISNPEPHLTLSAYRMDRGDLEGALAATEAALDADPTHARSKLRKAEILIEMGFKEDEAKLDEAEVLIDQVIEADPENSNALFVRAKLQIARGDLATGSETLRAAIVQRPRWAVAHMMLGSALFDLGDMAGARAEIGKAIELDAGLLDARFLMAKVHAALGEHEYAIEQGRVYLRVYRTNVSARLLVAESLAALGRRDDAVRELEAIPEEERTVEVYYALGKLAQLRGQLDEAREHLMAADRAKPNEPAVLGALMDLEVGQGQGDASLVRISAAAEAEPDSRDIAILLGRIRLLSRNTDGAEQAFQQAINLDPTDVTAYRLLANLYHGKGQLEDALSTYQQAAKARPELGWLYERLGLLYEKLGKPEEAMEYYAMAVERDPSLGLAKNNLSYLMVESGGDLDRALDLARQAKELRPKDPGTADTLGWALFKKGLTEEAITYLREAEKGWGDGNLAVGVVRHHLAMAYEANGAPEKASEVLADALASLDAQMQAAAKGGQTLEEPSWASDMREMQTRLKN